MKEATHILATDLDGTLVGDRKGLDELLEFYKNQQYEVSLVYITGRHYQSALSLIEEESLPVPDVLITDVGTEIHIGASLEKDRDWEKMMLEHWQPEAIDELAVSFEGINKQDLPVTNRCSYYAEDIGTVEAFEQRLVSAEIPHKLIYSGGVDLDILPAGSGKGAALEYILEKFNARDAKLLVAGDSGNDKEMLTLGFPSVIVGNAQSELLESPESPMIFRASKACAGGIQEAWTHFYPE
ncbi:HAD-IIB family hydrolase [Planococcus halotolerans]|uniref:Hydrolase n=1 Tax=Planococcus halotolerans TaxID=2233542 RepID=A0A365KRG2_9BACL|nr:HAD-IIB family hydrolase [Planococcus halotolerans]QHJ69269.1 HAD-IIB family hydrolase [Planococcus halotolerans]RAZ75754.1 hydrolase [Planococcus halotolerans]